MCQARHRQDNGDERAVLIHAFVVVNLDDLGMPVSNEAKEAITYGSFTLREVPSTFTVVAVLFS